MTTENYSEVKEKYNNKIVVIDDQQDFVSAFEWVIDEAGYEPFPIVVDGSFENITEVISCIPPDTYAVLCDHRLGKHGFDGLYGSDLVAALYDQKLPAILNTQFYDTDTDVSIRKYRHKIPVLLDKEDVLASTIKEGIKFCLSELNGTFSTNRKSYRNIVRIVDISKESREDVVDVIIPSWNPNKAVRLPSSLIREWILEFEPVIGTRLIANVNSGAKNSGDLYFTNFEVAPISEVNE